MSSPDRPEPAPGSKRSPKVVREETLFHGRIFDLKQVDLEVEGGRVIRREIVTHPGSVGVLPVTKDGRFLLVRQFRAPAGRRLLEAPAGTLEPGEPPDACAHRELIEEVGQKAATLRKFARFYLAPGWASEYMHGYIATGLSPCTGSADEDEDLDVEVFTPREALDAIRRGEIDDCKTVALIGLYLAEAQPERQDPWLDDNPDEA